MNLDSQAVVRVERLNYLFGGILVIAAAIAGTRSQALGVTVGVALTCLNFAILRRLVFRWTSAVKAGEPSAGNRMYLIMPKMMGLMGAVVVVILFLPIDAIAFVVGYSIFVLSIVVTGAIELWKMPTGDEEPSASPDPANDANKPS